MRKLANLKPERVFYYFEEISKIPRESGNEKAISDYLLAFAKEHGLASYRDEKLNVVLRKPATAGYEAAPKIVLQGHSDMVCEKETDSTHDFLKDPIDLVIEGDLVTANKTTLGADNGIAIAMGLAILESKDIPHGPLELLATVSEETDLGGAMALANDVLEGDMLINLDSEDEGRLTVGSAGGIEFSVDLPLEMENIKLLHTYRVDITNFQGGHSGVQIHQGRGNANKAMVEVLDLLKERVDYSLCSVEGGTKDNAIPREAVAVISSDHDLKEDLKAVLEEVKNLYIESEPKVSFVFKEVPTEYEAMTEDSFYRYLNLVEELPTGVYSWMEEYPDIVETSDNLAILRMKDKSLAITVSLRSSEPSAMRQLQVHMEEIATKYAAKFSWNSAYPEWRYRSESPLREAAIKVWKDITGKDMDVEVIHAGLECGAILQHYPDMDCISVGPQIDHAHIPGECLSISSTQKVYDFVLKLLAELR